MTDNIKVPEGYSFVRIINSGAFGTVVEMIEKSTNIHYAGKIVQCLTQKHKDRFDREVGRLKTFEHPRIIKLKESVTMEGNRVMIMELGGKSLAEIVKEFTERKVRMAREDVYRVMEDIASALELMHNHADGKTAHGDVKMENILIDANGHAKLCDFGAAESEDVSGSRSIMTLMYVSPERMASERGGATCEADVWSLGVVLYWLLFGVSPFKSPNVIQMIQEIASFKATQIPNSCGEEERALLMRMMDTLLQSNAFRCIVNTIEGVWKLKDEEHVKRIAVEEDRTKMEKEKTEAEAMIIQLLAEKQNPEATLKTLQEVRKEKVKTERENIQLMQKMEELRLQLPVLPIWAGTASLQTLDRTVYRLTATTLTQIVKLEPNQWRTAFTLPFYKALGFLRHPLPEDASQDSCGVWTNGIGGHFSLENGGMWTSGKEFQPARTNKLCIRCGQTAAIRVDMWRREARLVVDDEEQPGIFTDIPSPLCLGISTAFPTKNFSVEVLWLKRLQE
ncbi:putative CBL-interacting protein kinase 1 [Blattamonas nauphoetae]|uniref:CBL-interacting protein kinase 1 n=1 Tax=Blattamonas nauphoetae TaxID=2049346 RepID=A0ABQ9X088_9EUKA|nr:putative CBL-interacting protein kinase 1 [Blattamonas nauphoetae]